MFNAPYPNLELLEYKAWQLLKADDGFMAKLNEAKRQTRYVAISFEAVVFPQVWGSTCLGFDVMDDGSPAIGGSAMTKAYTTVFHESGVSDTYVVFFGENPCYKVTNANENFLEDLRNHQLVSLSEAKKRY